MKKEESDEKWKKVILIIFIVQGITLNVYKQTLYMVVFLKNNGIIYYILCF